MRLTPLRLLTVFVSLTLLGCRPERGANVRSSQESVGLRVTSARAPGGDYISWREHLIDDEATAGPELRGGDGLVIADLDRDGHLDIVSVHESDTEYDGQPDGLVRIAFGTSDLGRWSSVTVGSGSEVGAPEDVAVGDLNGDGYWTLWWLASLRT